MPGERWSGLVERLFVWARVKFSQALTEGFGSGGEGHHRADVAPPGRQVKAFKILSLRF